MPHYSALLESGDMVLRSDTAAQMRAAMAIYFPAHPYRIAKKLATLAQPDERISALEISARRANILKSKRLSIDDTLTTYGDDGIILWKV